MELLADVCIPEDCARNLLPVLYVHLVDMYGIEVAVVLSQPVLHPYFAIPSIGSDFAWSTFSLEDLVPRLRNFPIDTLSQAIRRLPAQGRPTVHPRSRIKTANGLAVHIRACLSFLESAGSPIVGDIWLSHFPFHSPSADANARYILDILEFEYGSTIIDALSSASSTKADRQKLARRQAKHTQAIVSAEQSSQRQREWPTRVPQDTILHCLNNYYRTSQWSEPPVCAVCAQRLHESQIFELSAGAPNKLHLEGLRLVDPFMIRKCVVQQMSARFTFGSPLIDGLMLDRGGIIDISVDTVWLTICQLCSGALTKANKVPRFALANRLFHGDLPKQFEDLTWVEEKICAIYCVTAHITRLFQSSDPSQPQIFHGNTCAHDMNVVSTASVLPRTPADINGFLSVIFVGPGKFDPRHLGPTFRVRKRKIHDFLRWLKHHNRLYSGVTLDMDVLAMYPDDDVLPGLSDCVVEDHELDVSRVFHDETAGFSIHPAELLQNADPISDSLSSEPGLQTSVVMLEKMGVSDPECDKISGRTFTAAALRNLHGRSDVQPDLVIHRGTQAINEYNNPDLLPGMFPTLFPFGIGGFEDKSRPTALSFQQQAQYYLNLADRSFRYHHSFLFVALNMIQRRAAHLHTFFTVKKSSFDVVAHKLTQVSPEVLNSLASRLECEHKVSQLTAQEKAAYTLLQQVNTISARIPGFQASKIYVWNEM